ncbi:spinster family MFS transporter [Oleisolibacter albus]|uniref:spinster family MFS transporter n=1 Tax=Oleisolibacter albus TaxID=2171757 RepID=UPI000DF4AAA1|nr:MFS transporter [Oleisolibacter albus]
MADITSAKPVPVPAPAAAADPRSGYRYYVLAILILVYIFNFLDRQIIGILATSIKAELGLSDGRLGLMGGLAFALFYTALGIPIAMLADRRSRTWIMTVSLALWSGFTALCGFATNFWQLFLCRMGVGVGEAGGVAPAYSLIADYFPPQERARALAAYSFGIPLGMAAGVLFGGLIAHAVGWREALIACGLAGVLIAPLFKLTVREPERGRFDPPAAARLPAPSLGEVLRTLAGKRSFWLLAFGASCSSVLGYGLAFWLPSFFARSYGLGLVDLSLYFSSIILAGGLIGVWMGGSLADRLGARNRANYARVPAAAFLLSIPFFGLGVLSPNLTVGFFLFVVPQALALMWLGPTLSAVQHLVPPGMRATASAIFLFVNNLLGIGFGTWFLGALSDYLGPRYGADSLRYSILYGLVFYLLAAGFYLLASRRLAQDWHR